MLTDFTFKAEISVIITDNTGETAAIAKFVLKIKN